MHLNKLQQGQGRLSTKPQVWSLEFWFRSWKFRAGNLNTPPIQYKTKQRPKNAGVCALIGLLLNFILNLTLDCWSRVNMRATLLWEGGDEARRGGGAKTKLLGGTWRRGSVQTTMLLCVFLAAWHGDLENRCASPKPQNTLLDGPQNSDCQAKQRTQITSFQRGWLQKLTEQSFSCQ